MVSASGYSDGAWNVKPTTSAVLTADTTYTYTFTAIMNMENHIAYISGYPNGKVHPDAKITRAEVATVVNRMLNRKADKKYVTANFKKLVQFADLKDPKAWYFYDMIEATNEHDYIRATDTSPEEWRSKKKK